MNSVTFLRFLFIALAGLSLSVLALPHDSPLGLSVNHRRHGSIARQTRRLSRRCKPRPHVQPAEPPKAEAAPEAPVQNNQAAPKGGNSNNNSGGLISVQEDRCGPNGATTDVTDTTGPNGSIDWLNCGLEQGSWNPPKITVDQIKTVSLGDAVKDPASPFHACDEHIDTFEKYAKQHGYPAIVLASIAMQESTCKADTVGGAGEQGLMQITEEKCAGAPGGNCRDPDFNIRTGADFFQSLLDKHDGDFLISLGAYNGWQKGMSLDEAKTRFGGNCRTQRNLDYLFQNLNGWYQNQNVYGGRKLGKFFNLDAC